jgi:uncharacterized lipoprotein YmbA
MGGLMGGLRALAIAGSIAGLLVLAGCGTSPPSSFYTLTPIPAASREVSLAGGLVGIGLGPVTFPAFLDRPQIVSRDSRNRLALDEINRWGGTLQDDFLRVWSENLSYLLGTSRIVIFPSEVRYPLDFRITADVLRFEGTPDGEAVLKVRWAVLDPYLEKALAVNEGTYREHFAETPLQSKTAGKREGEPDNRSALIAALSTTLAAFSQDVAAVVGRLPRPVEPTKESPLY